MISNMEGQLKQQGAASRLREVLEQVPRVRKDAGYPAAGHALQPDHRFAGRFQCHDGLLQSAVRIPLKWGTDSGEVGQRRSEATPVTAMISELPHMGQEFCW